MNAVLSLTDMDENIDFSMIDILIKRLYMELDMDENTFFSEELILFTTDDLEIEILLELLDLLELEIEVELD